MPVIRQVRESNAPAWNGWGVDYRNSRFQPAAAAGLSPGQVSRLQLKWAFGFPGATALYGQTVYDGRLYVTSNAGYVYSLDAETGCLHWSFRAQSAVRSGFTIGRLASGPRLAIFFGDIHGTAYALSAGTGEEIWKRSPIRIRSRESPARRCSSKDVCSCLSRRSKSRNRDRPTTPAAPSAASCPPSTQPPAARSGRRPRFLTSRRSSERTRVERHARAGRRRRLGDATLDLKRRALYITTGNAFAGTPRTAVRSWR